MAISNRYEVTALSILGEVGEGRIPSVYKFKRSSIIIYSKNHKAATCPSFRDTIGRGESGVEKGRFGIFPILVRVTSIRICKKNKTCVF